MKTFFLALSLLVCAILPALHAQSSAFTYQGQLSASGNAANGQYEFSFGLYDAPTNGKLAAPPLTIAPISVSNGQFTVNLDFGTNAFDGRSRWLEIAISLIGSDALTTVLTPRQPLTSAPYAIHAAKAASLVNLLSGALVLELDGKRALSLQPTAGSPNIVGGYNKNSVTSDVAGAFIGGGGLYDGSDGDYPNRVTADHGSIVGGWGNQVNAKSGFIGGGENNRIQAGSYTSTIGGGHLNHIEPNAWESFIGGGRYNGVEADSFYSTVSGGYQNTVQSNSPNSTIGGGYWNSLGPDISGGTISGGDHNQLMGLGGIIAGGTSNRIEANVRHATISGGMANLVQGISRYGAIGGGTANAIEGGLNHVIGGGAENRVGFQSYNCTIGGGTLNYIWPVVTDGTIGGGSLNSIGAENRGSTISGGQGNQVGVRASCSTVAGGEQNLISSISDCATIGGGQNNRVLSGAIGTRSVTIAGGANNQISSKCDFATIGGGFGNFIGSGSERTTIAGGFQNRIEETVEYASIGGGNGNIISNRADGACIPGGQANLATGKNSFAAGYSAQALHDGSFVWADNAGTEISSVTNNQFTIRSSGGVRLYTDTNSTTGAELAPGSGSWSSLSDRKAKKHFTPVDPLDVLEKLVALPLASWSYKAQADSVRHLGPIAQDFRAAFGLGEDERRISSVDADGVAMAAIQGLHQKLEAERKERRERQQASDAEVDELKAQIRQLKELLEQVSTGKRIVCDQSTDAE